MSAGNGHLADALLLRVEAEQEDLRSELKEMRHEMKALREAMRDTGRAVDTLLAELRLRDEREGE